MPQLDLIGIVVEDMPRSLAFYRRLGLDVAPDADSQPHVEVALPGGLRLAWDTLETIRSFDPDFAQPSASGISLAFLMESSAALDAAYEELREHGHKPPWDAFWGQRYAILHDPDGNTVDLFAPLP
jgi:catechol 2,3-dioxygenase-like lactoylglutathione lyase family enzyme